MASIYGRLFSNHFFYFYTFKNINLVTKFGDKFYRCINVLFSYDFCLNHNFIFLIYKITTLFFKQASRLLLFLPVLQHLQFSGPVKIFSNKISFILYFRGPSCKSMSYFSDWLKPTLRHKARWCSPEIVQLERGTPPCELFSRSKAG